MDTFSFVVPSRELITVNISGGDIQRHTLDWNSGTNTPVANLWHATNHFIESQFDTNSRISVLWYIADPNCPQDRKDKIIAVRNWWSSVWAYYASQKALIIQGQEAYFDPNVPGNCPYTIWDISS